MIKRIMVVVALVGLVVGSAWGFSSAIGSGKIASSAVVVAQPCYLFAVMLRDDGTNALTVTVYDSNQATTAADRLISEQKIEAGGDRGSRWVWMFPRKCEYGIYVVVSGGTGYAVVEYNYN